MLDGDLSISRETTLSILREENLKRRRGTRNLRICMVLIALLTVAAELMGVARGHAFDWSHLIPILLLVPAGVSMGMNPDHKLTARKASMLNDVRAIGGLVEVLDCGEPELVGIAESALVSLLPLVQEGDGELLDEAQETVLVAALNRTSNYRFYGVGVGALRFLGTRRTLGALDAFAAIAPPQIKDKAQAESLARMAAADLRMRLARTQISSEVQSEQARLDEMGRRVLE